jgi:hypothetical protein
MKTWALALAALCSIQPAFSRGNVQTSRCGQRSLSPAVRQSLAHDFASWRLQEASGLSSSARQRWSAERIGACPGVAVGHFEGAANSYAILLVPKSQPDAAYRLVVFSDDGPRPRRLTLDQLNGGGAGNFFIRPVQMRDFFSKSWRKKLNVSANDGIMVADVGTGEYEVDVYYWSGGRFRHEPVDR